MPPSDFRVILDTNILVRAFIDLKSAPGRLLRACQERRVVPLLSIPALREYRDTLGDKELTSRYPQLENPEVSVAIERLIYVSDVFRRIRVRFPFPRDPKDSYLIELAIAGRASHLITTDNDLHALPTGRNDASRRFRQRLPHLEIAKPEDFLGRYGHDLGIE